MHRQQVAISNLYFLTQTEADSAIRQQAQQRAPESDSQMKIDYARRPKTLTLTASTRKAVEASYLASWVQKIEHTGNLNYPSEARVNRIDGRLRMSVRLNAAGEVLDMEITSSSGTTVLDEAAKRILRMAQPFDPFSEELRELADQIVIIRTWDFKSNRFKTQSGVS